VKADLTIKNARVVDHTGEYFGGVSIAQGRILTTGENDALPDARLVVDAEGHYLLP